MFEIGNSLRDARLRRELDFPELERGTKIRAKYLRALEDESFDQLPAATYIKGFLRTYADYLGLDGQLYVDEYNVRYASGDEVLERGVRRGRSTPRASPAAGIGGSSRTIVWLTLVGIAVVTALVIAAWRYGGSEPPTLPLQPAGGACPCQGTERPARTRRARAAPLLIVRAGSDSGRQLWNGTLSDRETQRFDAGTGSGCTSARRRTSR